MKYTQQPTPEMITGTIQALKEHGVDATLVTNGAEALQKIKELIPTGASVMNGASKTLEQIGFIDYLKSDQHQWNNFHATILAEKDVAKQMALRKQTVLSDYYLGSVHALAMTGEFIVASNSGSQLPHIVYTSPNLIFVVGTQKIVPTLADAFARLQEYVVPLEDARMKQIYGRGTMLSKIVVFKRENPAMGRTVRMLLVNEPLGF